MNTSLHDLQNTDAASLQQIVQQIEDGVAADHAAYNRAADLYTAAAAKLATAEDLLAAAQLAHGTILALAEHVQHGVAARLSVIASRCLAAVFDDPYTFKIVFEPQANRTTARCVFFRDGHELDPAEESGYGAIDVASFGLRCAALSMCRPAPRRLLVMDEPFRFVSVDRRPRLVQLLQVLCDELGVQIVMVTHIPELRIGEVVDL